MAVSFQFGDAWIWLIVSTRNFCSSTGSEYAAWPSWYPGALRNDTAGMVLVSTTLEKSVMSYWWLAWSVLPIMAVELGGK